MTAPRESELMRSIMHALSGRCALWRNNVGVDTARGVRYGLGVGSPDLVGIHDGRFIGIEVKTATGRMRPAQLTWADHARRHGARIVTARSIEEALECLK